MFSEYRLAKISSCIYIHGNLGTSYFSQRCPLHSILAMSMEDVFNDLENLDESFPAEVSEEVKTPPGSPLPIAGSSITGSASTGGAARSHTPPPNAASKLVGKSSVAKAPVDIIGTGSYIPDIWEETYATADIINYNGKDLVKKGREFLLKNKV